MPQKITKSVINWLFGCFNEPFQCVEQRHIRVNDQLIYIPRQKRRAGKTLRVSGCTITVNHYDDSNESCCIRNDKKIIFCIDMISEIIPFFTMERENDRIRDVHGRVLFDEKYDQELIYPKLDLLIHFFKKSLSQYISLNYKPFPTVRSTHDVDRLGYAKFYQLLTNISSCRKHRSFAPIIKSSLINPDDQFKRILTWENDHNFESLWFILPVYKCLQQADYPLNYIYKKIKDKIIPSNIGWHISYMSSYDSDHLKNEYQKINNYWPVRDTRAHYLRGNMPDLFNEPFGQTRCHQSDHCH